MFRMVFILAAVAGCAGCSKPSLKDALAQCTVEARRAIGPVQDNDPYIADCMDGRGYRIRERECGKVESPARVEACYRPKSAR